MSRMLLLGPRGVQPISADRTPEMAVVNGRPGAATDNDMSGAIRRLLVATTNTGKLAEIRAILAGLPVEIGTLADVPAIDAPAEAGETFAANARLKALYYSDATGLPTVAEDSGLEVDALGGSPGVQSARFGGVHTSYPEKFALLYDALRATGTVESAARFVCALAVVENGRIVFEARGVVEGRIAPRPAGLGGFGYDPIFFYPPFGCTLAEAGDRKSEVSHRGEAFRQLRMFLN
jgi:XTP/dITP diphosphohydrolase